MEGGGGGKRNENSTWKRRRLPGNCCLHRLTFMYHVWGLPRHPFHFLLPHSPQLFLSAPLLPRLSSFKIDDATPSFSFFFLLLSSPLLFLPPRGASPASTVRTGFGASWQLRGSLAIVNEGEEIVETRASLTLLFQKNDRTSF